MYSAIKVNGKKLYEYARLGKTVDVKPRNIEIYNITLNEFDKLNNEIIFTVACSKGTYIRTLCEDIANKLNLVGCMKELQRIQVGIFNIDNSVKIEELEENKDNSIFLKKYFIEFEEILKDKPIINLSNDEIRQFLNGVKLNKDLQDGIYKVKDLGNNFIGTAEVKDRCIKRDVVIWTI